MASSASAPSPNPPLSPQNDAEEGQKRRKRKVDRNSSSSSPPQPPPPQQTEQRHFKRKIKIQRNRTFQDNRIANFSLDHNSTFSSSSSSSDESEEELKRQRARRSLNRLRKSSNRITSSSFISIGGNKSGGTLSPLPIPLLPLPLSLYSDNEFKNEDEKSIQGFPKSSLPSFHLKWEEQHTHIGSEILTFFTKGHFVDVTLIVDDLEMIGEDDLLSQRKEKIILTHRIILASFSEYFRRLLQENPCKHPVVLLKGFRKWELETIIQFMYTGKINVRSEDVENLLRAADVLQIRGIRECLGREWNGEFESRTLRVEVEPRPPPLSSKPQSMTTLSTRSCDNNEDVKGEGEGVSRGMESPKLLNLSMSCRDDIGQPLVAKTTSSTSSHQEGRGDVRRNEPQTTIAHHLGFSMHPHHHHHPSQIQHQQQQHQQHQQHSASSPPFPRRKQARPRRRSGDFVAQDVRLTLSPSVPPPDFPFAPHPLTPRHPRAETSEEGGVEDAVLDFTLHHHRHHLKTQKKRSEELFPEGMSQDISNQFMKTWPMGGVAFDSLTLTSPLPKRHASPMKREVESEDVTLSPIEPRNYHSPSGTPPEDSMGRYSRIEKGSRSKGTAILSTLNGHGPGTQFKAASPPTSPFLMNLSSSSNGHTLHHQSDSESNNTETCSTPPTIFSPSGFPPPPPPGTKKGSNDSQGTQQPWPGLPLAPAPIFGRHRAQHSAPRGGPPRAWSNADLTEALHNVWNKKMTTSQASRIFGIPYNSLLMYVRGKYGKSLKLDLLKKGLDLAMESNAAAVKANKKAGTSSGRGPPSPTTSPSSNNATPPHNNNNTIPSKGGKGRGDGSPPMPHPPTLSLPSLLTQGGLSGRQSPEHLRSGHPHNSPEANAPLGDMMPPGFNPFSMGAIFGDYPPPFPFPSAAAANAALSHILPPHPHHHHLLNTQRRIQNHNATLDK